MDDLLSELVSKAGAMSDEELSSLMRQLEVLKSGREKQQERHEVAVDGRLAMPCPHCGSVSTMKYGKYRGTARYKCKDCGKTFTSTTGTMFYHSKLSVTEWKKLLEGMVLNRSNADIAQDLQISA